MPLGIEAGLGVTDSGKKPGDAQHSNGKPNFSKDIHFINSPDRGMIQVPWHKG